MAVGAALGWAAARALHSGRTGRATVLYDGGCPLCRSTVDRLRRWDTRRRLEYLDASDVAAVRARFANLAADSDPREMRLVLESGVVLGGFKAVRALAVMLPRFRWFSPVFFLPGMSLPGAVAYRFVAARRVRDVPCSDGTCRLHSGL